MKRQLLLLGLGGLLAGCTAIDQFHDRAFQSATTTGLQNQGAYQLATEHWADVAKIRNHATQLSILVNQGKLTKVGAALQLDAFRKKLLGQNIVDDSMAEVYLRLATNVQRGVMNSRQSEQILREALQGWQQRWNYIQDKPGNPAFTNFLMELMQMQPLH